MSFQKIKVVCFGGGTGLSELLGGLKRFDDYLDISAIVSVFDTGGSSGELRDRFGILPPGDIFKCILALTPEKDYRTFREFLLKRIKGNHTMGNFIMLGASQTYSCNKQLAVDSISSGFSISGHIYPVSVEEGNLCAVFEGGPYVEGEDEIDRYIRKGKKVKLIKLKRRVKANPSAIEAIRDADILIVGPGSFYTSVLPNFLPDGIKWQISLSNAKIVSVVNLITEGLGMRDCTMEKFLMVLENYMEESPTWVLANSMIPENLSERYEKEGKFIIKPHISADSTNVISTPLWLDGSLARHDPGLLASEIFSIIAQL